MVPTRPIAWLTLIAAPAAAAIPPPPPPLPKANDPQVQQVMDQAKQCFWSQWDRSTDLRFRAEKAVRENHEQAIPAAVRSIVLDYVKSRTELKKCMAKLQAGPLLAAASEHDRAAISSELQHMESNYLPQTRFELAILIGLLDKQAGAEELAYPDP